MIESKRRIFVSELVGFLNIHPDNVQSADSQDTKDDAFSQMGFLGLDFYCVFSDKYSVSCGV